MHTLEVIRSLTDRQIFNLSKKIFNVSAAKELFSLLPHEYEHTLINELDKLKKEKEIFQELIKNTNFDDIKKDSMILFTKIDFYKTLLLNMMKCSSDDAKFIIENFSFSNESFFKNSDIYTNFFKPHKISYNDYVIELFETLIRDKTRTYTKTYLNVNKNIRLIFSENTHNLSGTVEVSIKRDSFNTQFQFNFTSTYGSINLDKKSIQTITYLFKKYNLDVIILGSLFGFETPNFNI